MSRAQHLRFAVAAACFAVVGFLEKPIADRRPAAPDRRGAIRVTSPLDEGTGSLRDAISKADTSKERALIEIVVPSITLETPLAPLVNPEGVFLDVDADAAPGQVFEIDGSKLSEGALLTIDAPASSVSNLTLRSAGGRGIGIMVRSKGVKLHGLKLTEFEEGIHILAGAGAVVVEGSTFERNGTGVGVDADVSPVHIERNHFRDHVKAAVWAVSPEPAPRNSDPALFVDGNDFTGDRLSAVVIHVPAQVSKNVFHNPGEAAVYVSGSPVLRVSENRVDAGASVGIYADDVDGALLYKNEVSHSQVGILLRGSRGAELRENKVFGNSYGIAVFLDGAGAPNLLSENLVLNQRLDGLYMVGASPLLERNQVRKNRLAGLKVEDYIPLQGPRVISRPAERDNVYEGNGSDGEVRGEYRERPSVRAEPRP
jgi:hypothetical protein